ncbi:MAG TPA: hypothetical protein VGO47_09695, partial [Chlamydiales bacterium]|jgi:hypothetical protein|nr:hypothetical protein [Chlamydiales bacterium]
LYNRRGKDYILSARNRARDLSPAKTRRSRPPQPFEGFQKIRTEFSQSRIIPNRKTQPNQDRRIGKKNAHTPSFRDVHAPPPVFKHGGQMHLFQRSSVLLVPPIWKVFPSPFVLEKVTVWSYRVEGIGKGDADVPAPKVATSTNHVPQRDITLFPFLKKPGRELKSLE